MEDRQAVKFCPRLVSAQDRTETGKRFIDAQRIVQVLAAKICDSDVRVFVVDAPRAPHTASMNDLDFYYGRITSRSAIAANGCPFSSERAMNLR
jgi:hypothetical protein